jgi:hypothetical protein
MWVYGCNDHLEGLKELPAGFEASGVIAIDFPKICQVIGAAPHPAFKPRATTNSKGGGRKQSMLGFEGTGTNPSAPVREGPYLSIRSTLLDRCSMQILSLLLPTATNIKVLCFSDCRLDGETLGLLRQGLSGSSCLIESLQIEWNPFELPLPTVEEMASLAPAAADPAPDAGEGAEKGEAEGEAAPAPAEAPPPAEAEPAGGGAALHPGDSLEAREMRRYQLQSWRVLRSFREWLEDLAGSLSEAFAKLAPNGASDLETRLGAGDLHGILEARLGAVGPHVTEVYEALDGPEYGAGQGFSSLLALKAALEGLPEEKDPGNPNDSIGLMLAPFMDSVCALQSFSLRACSISRLELGPLCACLSQGTPQLRCLNLWENRICDRGAKILATALDEYRKLEYLGLGRNRITAAGLGTICVPFSVEVVSEAVARDMRQEALDKILKAQAEEAKKNAKKAPPKKGAKEEEPAAPPPPPPKISLAGRTRGEGLKAAVLEERPRSPEDQEPVLVWRRACELRTLVLADNPIAGVRAEKEIEALAPLGPKGAELVLIGAPAAKALASRRPDLTTTGNRKDRLSSGGEGWVLKLV